MEIMLKKADKDLFAVYQSIYSNADINMVYDWEKRLEDTNWTDDCYFLILDGQKIGGALITEDRIRFAFLIPPFCDRTMFWRLLLEHARKPFAGGVLCDDRPILLMLNYKNISIRRAMCRPADTLDICLDKDFICRDFDVEKEAVDIGAAIMEGYGGGIDEEIYGASTPDSVIQDLKRVMEIYTPRNFSHVITEKSTGKIAGVCLAGTGKNYIHDCVEIADICVLPEYRGRGLARYMIGCIINNTYGVAPYVKLFVTVGNNAEYLYRQMGFMPGPSYATMARRS